MNKNIKRRTLLNDLSDIAAKSKILTFNPVQI